MLRGCFSAARRVQAMGVDKRPGRQTTVAPTRAWLWDEDWAVHQLRELEPLRAPDVGWVTKGRRHDLREPRIGLRMSLALVCGVSSSIAISSRSRIARVSRRDSVPFAHRYAPRESGMDSEHSIEVNDPRRRVPPILSVHCTCGWRNPPRMGRNAPDLARQDGYAHLEGTRRPDNAEAIAPARFELRD